MLVLWILVAFVAGAAIGGTFFMLAGRAESAALRATLVESQRTGEASIEALLERTKNELRDSTAARAGERVNELVAPVSQKLGEFEKLMREIESGRKLDAGGLKEQLSGLLHRTEQLETAAARHRIEWHWVPGHAGVPGNERCDVLANAAIDGLLALDSRVN